MYENDFNGIPQPPKASGMAIATLVLGIAGLIIGLFVNVYIGMICGIVGIVLGSMERKRQPSTMVNAGFICSLVATAVSAASLVCALCVIGSFISAFS